MTENNSIQTEITHQTFQKFERFDTDQINKISIADFLTKEGYVKKNRNEAYGMYLAVWRGDCEPSLRVDYAQNSWYDFGTKKGGTIISLIKEMYQLDFVEACKKLCSGNIPKVEMQTKSTVKKPQGIKILSEKPVSNFVLKEYLTQRGIDKFVAMEYLKEIEFTTEQTGVPYFGLGFKSDSGDYEIRNKYYKGCSGKDITTIDKSLPSCNVFEGFFDFLSYETLSKRFSDQYQPANALILNGVALVGRHNVKDFLLKHKTINCYFDNDIAGWQTFADLNEAIGSQCVVNDCSLLYAEYKDFNKFLEDRYKISQGQRL
jgi:hypothetical protein